MFRNRTHFILTIIGGLSFLVAFQNCGVMRPSRLIGEVNPTSLLDNACSPYANENQLNGESQIEPLAFLGNPNFDAPVVSRLAFLTWDGRVSFGPGKIKSTQKDPRTPVIKVSSGTSLSFNQNIAVAGFNLVMQSDCNLVLYKTGPGGGPLWDTKTNGKCTSGFAAFQGDGNLVIYGTNATGAITSVVYSSGTAGNPNAEFLYYASVPFFKLVDTDGMEVTSGWTAKVFRSEYLSESISPASNDNADLATKLNQAYSEAYPWAVAPNMVDPEIFPDVEIIPFVTTLAIFPDRQYAENPYNSDINGNAVQNGTYHTYQAQMISQDNPGNGGTTRLGLISHATIVVRSPRSPEASIQKISSSKDFLPLTDVMGQPIYGIEPTITFDGQLIVYQNWEENANRGNLFYISRSDNQTTATGWSVPKSISQIFQDQELQKRYPLARYPLRDSQGAIFQGRVPGAYPWMSLDGTDIIWSFTVHDDGARRAGTSVAGSSTQGLIRLIDGGPNNSRRGCIQGNNPNFQEMRSCSSSNVRSHRLFMASIGRSPGMWSPFEFTENRVLPITDKLYTYPIYDATSARYAEVSLEESVVGNYDLYLEMSEGVTQAGDYDKSVTPDVSGHFFVPQLNAGARFAEETFSDCNDRICPQNNFQDPSVPLFSGKTIYFNSDGAINVNANSSTGFQMLKDAKDLTLSIAVRPIRPFNTQEGSTAIYSDLLQKQDSFKVSLGENGKITTSIRVKMPDNSVKDLSSGFVGPDLPQGSWSHIAVTYSSTTHQMRTFIDSQLVHEIVLAESAGLNVNLASNFVIGPNKPGQSTLQLALDQVGVSRVVRTEDEIRRQAQLRLPHSTPSQERLPLGLKTKDLKNPSLLKAGLNCSKVILGRHLFFDPRLSADNKTSCATCHDPDQGFAEDMALHESRLASLGETSHLLRNTPGLFNLAFRSHFLRDGRARSLSEQARLVTSNPHEMGSDPEKIIAKLAASNQYKALFQKAFPESNNPFSTQNIFASLQEFELTLLSAESRFDQYLDGNLSALNERELRGKSLFFGKARCAECHSGTAFTNDSAHNIGLDAKNLLGFEDLGRLEFTLGADDRSRFLTPSLRNIELTPPYFHDGSAKTLEEAIKHYNTVFEKPSNGSPLDSSITLINLSDDEVDDLAAFLKTLTGRLPEVKVPIYSDPIRELPQTENLSLLKSSQFF